MTNRKIIKFLGPEKSISKKDFQVKKFIFSPPAPKCTFDRSGGRRVRVFCTSSVRCDAGFDFFGSECAKGSRNKHLELAAAPEGSEFRSLNERKTREFPRFFDIGIIECAEGSIFSGRYTPKNLNHPAKAPPRPRPPRLQAAPRCKQARKRQTLPPPVPEFRTPMSIGGALAKLEPS